MQRACMHASARGRAVSRVHLPASELSQGGGPPGGHPREPSHRRLRLLAWISFDIRGICLTQSHHHQHLMPGRGSGKAGLLCHALQYPSARSAALPPVRGPPGPSPGPREELSSPGSAEGPCGSATLPPGTPSREPWHSPGLAPGHMGSCSGCRPAPVLVPHRPQQRP